MRKSDVGHKLTEKELVLLEKKISDVYKQTRESLEKTVEDYFAEFKARDEKQKRLLEQGKITKEHYTQWRLNQIGRGKRFEALRDEMARRYTDANAVAVAYTNDKTPGIYSLNRNYAAYTIDMATDGGFTFPDGQKMDGAFTLFDEQTVKRLLLEDPGLMPNYPEKRALRRGIDLAYGKQQITASVTSSILQGKTIRDMATDLQSRMETMNRASAIRTARTATTCAQNAGRMDSYVAAQNMGIKLEREWLATLDGRTRHTHAMLDGQRAPLNKPFVVDGDEIMFPGDPSAKAALVYNCRCTLIAAVAGVDTSDAKRRARDPETGKSVLISDMSYQEWAGWKKKETVAKPSGNDTMKRKTDGVNTVKTIGRIDVNKFRVVADNIRTDEVVITDERINHIQQRHPNDYERYAKYMEDIISNPQYIIEANKPNTAFLLKEYIEDEEHIQMIIRLAVEADEPWRKNSVITFLRVEEKRFNRYLRTKNILYKSE